MKALEIKKEDFNRFGAALLFLVGKAVRLEDFGWALSITGPNGDQLLVDELRNASAIDENGILLPGETIMWLLSKISPEDNHNNDYAKLVWTLPLIKKGHARNNFDVYELQRLLSPIYLVCWLILQDTRRF